MEQDKNEEQPLTLKNAFFDLLDLIEAAVTTFFVFMLLFTYVLKPVTVDGSSMVPTLYNQDSLLMMTLMSRPEAGRIVVIDDKKSGYFTDEEQTQVAQREGFGSILVKRVIAVGGQEVNIDFREGYGTVAVDGVQLPEDYIADLTTRDDGAFRYRSRAPEGYSFVAGDNRLRSTESRRPPIGLVPQEQVLGTVLLRYDRDDKLVTKWTDRFAWLIP